LPVVRAPAVALDFEQSQGLKCDTDFNRAIPVRVGLLLISAFFLEIHTASR
jgi:hypothetical protein